MKKAGKKHNEASRKEKKKTAGFPGSRRRTITPEEADKMDNQELLEALGKLVHEVYKTGKGGKSAFAILLTGMNYSVIVREINNRLLPDFSFEPLPDEDAEDENGDFFQDLPVGELPTDEEIDYFARRHFPPFPDEELSPSMGIDELAERLFKRLNDEREGKDNT